MNINSLVFILGTRPEAIKLAPLILEARKRKFLNMKIILTGQHPILCKSTLKEFGIYDILELEPLAIKHSLINFSGHLLNQLNNLNINWEKSLIFVQGDTTSALVGAYAAFLSGSQTAHIEAGLRTHQKNPFPEEMNRKLISQLADFHFCVTETNVENLINEGVNQDRIFLVGNTVIDALLNFGINPGIQQKSENIIITLHRRENIGKNIKEATAILNKCVNSFASTFNWKFIMHPNPIIRESYDVEFLKNSQVELLEPLNYEAMLNELKNAKLLITDSGGFQEEATFLGLPTLILRESTERPEAIEKGSCILVQNIVEDLERLIYEILQTNSNLYKSMLKSSTVFGNGNTSRKIFDFLYEL